MAEKEAADLDESRRLLYMAIFAPQCKRYNLAGTLVNSLRHHRGFSDRDLESKVLMLVNGTVGSVADDEAEGWARKKIAQITEDLATL